MAEHDIRISPYLRGGYIWWGLYSEENFFSESICVNRLIFRGLIIRILRYFSFQSQANIDLKITLTAPVQIFQTSVNIF